MKIKKQKLEQEKLMEQRARAEEQLGTITESYKTAQEENAVLRRRLAEIESRYKAAKK